MTTTNSRWDTFLARASLVAAVLWKPVREHARKLIPSRAVRWTVLYVPGFTVALLFAMKVLGKPIAGGGNSFDDLFAYVIECGSRSVPVLIAIALTYGVATGLGWNLDNAYRKDLQDRLAEDWLQGAGAFFVLAGEMVSILVLLVVILFALLVWQG